MKKIVILFALSFIGTIVANAQKFSVEKSVVSFFSEAPVENIAAENKKAGALLDLTTGQFVFSIPIAEFQFEKQLMKEHFNEKYMDTEKYPKSIFQGIIVNLNSTAIGLQNVSAKGKLTIRGVTKEVEIPGSIEISSDNHVFVKASFKVLLKDYDIKIPQILWQNIAEEIEIKVDFTFKPKP